MKIIFTGRESINEGVKSTLFCERAILIHLNVKLQELISTVWSFLGSLAEKKKEKK